MIGYREFRVCEDGLLQGLFLQLWETREMEARCLCDLAVVSTPVDATAPVDQPPHACGIYLQRYPVPPMPGSVGAACVGWGKVVAHEWGWRVQHCRIERLILPPRPVDALLAVVPSIKKRYGVPVEPYERAGDALNLKAEWRDAK